MRSLALLLLINFVLITCHQIVKREVDEEGYDWDAGAPHHEHFHYTEDGELDFAPRIIGGTPASHGEFPAKVSIQTRAGNHFCGGALIDLRHVLTAAHCLTTTSGAVLDNDAFRIMGDDTSIQRHGSPSRQLRFPSHIFVHPSFDVVSFQADIGIIRVSVPFWQTNTLRFMPRSFWTPVDDQNCQLAGWGVTAETNVRPHPILMRVELQIVPMEFCNGTQSFHGSIPIGFICAGSPDGSRDACFGDSGGGLICNGAIAGIVSFGFGCGRRNFPGAYIDVSQWNHWIQECLSWDGPPEAIPRPTPIPEWGNSVDKLFVPAKLVLALMLAISIFIH